MSEPKVYRRQTPHPPAIDEEASILFISVDRIRPNRAQPRNRFDTNTMIRLADSVRRYGILQPLTVRLPKKRESDQVISHTEPIMYELIAGERRLRAAKLAGLTHVPCILASADDHLSAELAVIENLLREDLNMFEQARAFGRLIVQFSLTQEQVARKMSMSQSAVANKLRLLRLRDAEQKAILEGGLTERHARALLRLPPDAAREGVIRLIIERHMNVAATEEYIDGLLLAQKSADSDGQALEKSVGHAEQASERSDKLAEQAPQTTDPTVNAVPAEQKPPIHEESGESSGKKKLILKDLRIFYNSLERAVGILKQTGLAPEIEQRENGNRLEIRISVDNPSGETSPEIAPEAEDAGLLAE